MYNKKRYILLMWWGGSGKSTFQAQNEIIKTFQAKTRLLCIRKVKDTCKDSVFSELVWVIDEWGLWDYFTITKSPMSITNLLTGSDIIFRGIDDPEKIKSIRRVSRVWIEEATELTNEDFNQIDLRLRWQKEMQIIMTFNPIDKDHWINERLWSKWITDDVELLHTTYLDNRWVGPEYIQVMNRLKEDDPRMYNIYALGQWWSRVEGLIFQFRESQIPQDAKLLWFGTDFWFTNDPTTIVAVYLKKNPLYSEDNPKEKHSLYFEQILYKTHQLDSDIIRVAREYITPTDDWVADSANPWGIEAIYRSWFNIRWADKFKGSINYWISLMKEYNLHITPNSGDLKKEFNNYCWKKDKSGKVLDEPIDAFNHGIDGIRYLCLYKLANKKKLIVV